MDRRPERVAARRSNPRRRRTRQGQRPGGGASARVGKPRAGNLPGRGSLQEFSRIAAHASERIAAPIVSCRGSGAAPRRSARNPHPPATWVRTTRPTRAPPGVRPNRSPSRSFSRLRGRVSLGLRLRLGRGRPSRSPRAPNAQSRAGGLRPSFRPRAATNLCCASGRRSRPGWAMALSAARSGLAQPEGRPRHPVASEVVALQVAGPGNEVHSSTEQARWS